MTDTNNDFSISSLDMDWLNLYGLKINRVPEGVVLQWVDDKGIEHATRGNDLSDATFNSILEHNRDLFNKK